MKFFDFPLLTARLSNDNQNEIYVHSENYQRKIKSISEKVNKEYGILLRVL